MEPNPDDIGQVRASVIVWSRMFELLLKMYMYQLRPVKLMPHNTGAPATESEMTATIKNVAVEELSLEGKIAKLPQPQQNFAPPSNN